MRFVSIFLFVFSFLSTAEEVANHPAPRDPTYLKKNLIADMRATLGPPPTMMSAEQKQDETTLRNFHSSRTVADCEKATNEVYVSLENFFGPRTEILTKEEVEEMKGFFDQVRNDADYFIQQLKTDFPRQRPFRYMTDLKPCVPVEITLAYPSGHAVLSKLYASILTEVRPEKKMALEERAMQISRGRILSGMHHPTDIEAGRNLANFMFDKFKRSKEFKAQLDKFKQMPVQVLAR